MLFERIEAEGLAHYSYIVGDQGVAAVIDPKRDCACYLDIANAHGMRICTILETHRNEDYVIGSRSLFTMTGAAIWHADTMLDYRYGSPVSDGQRFKIGRLSIEAISSPGHTPGGMSYLLRDLIGQPWVLFCGDTIFAGDVGRVDLSGMDNAAELGRALYHTIHSRILPLGDGVMLCPAHGAGSACGMKILDRPWTTIGIERLTSRKLQIKSEQEFVSAHAVYGEKPPYFSMMERMNLLPSAECSAPARPFAMSAIEFSAKASEAFVLDVRSELSYSAAHIPGSQFIWLDGLAKFAGWFIPYDRPLLLVTETAYRDKTTSEASAILFRMGYDNVLGYLAEGLVGWHAAGLHSNGTRTITVRRFCRKLDEDGDDGLFILDVRSAEEAASSMIQNAKNISLTMLPSRMQEVPKDMDVYIFCGSGMRATVASSLLQRSGWKNLVVVLGGISGWKSLKCQVQVV
jgi:hydroxyacylglutathione hydrolase